MKKYKLEDEKEIKYLLAVACKKIKIFSVFYSENKKIKLELFSDLEGHAGYVNDMKFILVGNNTINVPKLSLLSAGDDKLIKLWDLEKSENLKIFKGHIDSVRCLVNLKFGIENNKNLFASGGADEKIFIWDIQKSEIIEKLEAHKDGVFCMVQIPNKESLMLISGSGGYNEDPIKIWK